MLLHFLDDFDNIALIVSRRGVPPRLWEQGQPGDLEMAEGQVIVASTPVRDNCLHSFSFVFIRGAGARMA